jgi:hypothetical protein
MKGIPSGVGEKGSGVGGITSSGSFRAQSLPKIRIALLPSGSSRLNTFILNYEGI